LKKTIKTLAIWGIIGVIFVVLISSILENTDRKLSYSDLVKKIEANEVESVEINSSGESANVKIKDEAFQKEVNIPNLENFMNTLDEPMKNGQVSVTRKSESWFMVVLGLLTPFGLLIIFFVFWFMLMNRNQGAGKTMSFGKSKARNITEIDKNKVTFNDVAGVDEEKEELQEIVEFLKSPKKFTDMGARIPKGVLLVGHPGTGKTLLA
jgi:cell division protease FtsH